MRRSGGFDFYLESLRGSQSGETCCHAKPAFSSNTIPAIEGVVNVPQARSKPGSSGCFDRIAWCTWRGLWNWCAGTTSTYQSPRSEAVTSFINGDWKFLCGWTISSGGFSRKNTTLWDGFSHFHAKFCLISTSSF